MWLMIDFAAPLVGSCQVALDKLKGVDYGYGYFRSGSVCLNSLLGPDKWMTAFVMLPAGLPAAY